MARIRIDDLQNLDQLTAEEEALILGAGRLSFQPTFEALESRELMDAGLGWALLPPLEQGAGEPSPHEQKLTATQTPVLQVDYGQFGVTQSNAGAPRGAALADPLDTFHRQYAGLKDLRKGDILLNTTKGPISETIQFFSGAKYNHTAVYVGDGMIAEAVSTGVRVISLKEFLKDDHIVRTMVVRNANLNDAQRDAIARFCVSKVGKPYNLGGLAPQVLGIKGNNAAQFDRADYYCSQLAAAAYSSAKVALHANSLDLSPGELAALVKTNLTAVGALYDEGYHRSSREGLEFVNLDVTDQHQDLLKEAFRDRSGGSFHNVRVNRLTVDSSGRVLGFFTVIESYRQYDVHINNRNAQSVDAWTAKLCRQLYDLHFGGERSPDATTPTWVVERAVGQGVASELNKAFAGKSLDGQKIDRVELVRAENFQGHLFEVEVRVSFNNGAAHANLRISVFDGGLGQRDFSCGRIEAIGGYQLSEQSLGQIKSALKVVPVDSATKLQADTVRRAVLNALNKTFAGQHLNGQKIDSFLLGSVDGSHRYQFTARVQVSLNNGAAFATLEFTFQQGFFENNCDLHCLSVQELGGSGRFTDDTLSYVKEVVKTLWVDASGTLDPITPQDMQFVQKRAEQLLQEHVLNQLDRSGRKSPDAIVLESSASLFAEDQIRIDFKVKYNTTRHSTAIGDVPNRTSAIGTISLHFKAVWKGDKMVYEIILPSLNNFEKGPHIDWQQLGQKLEALCSNHQIQG